MKTKNRLLILSLFGIGFLSLQAQNLATLDETVIKDTVFAISQKSDIISKTVHASGQVAFSSKSGYVRVLLTDESGYDLLVYETFPLLATNGIDVFDNVALETGNIPSFFSATRIRVEIENAELKNLSIDVSEKGIIKEQQQKVKSDRITLINKNLRKQNELWTADETSVSQLSYEEKKHLFKGRVPDLQGFEYYKGGVFKLYSDNKSENDLKPGSSQAVSINCISSFDWRNRHGQYWLTSVKSQSPCGSCGIFAATGATEALVNLYYNQHINYDLAEQQAVSCLSSSSYNCNTGWFPSDILDYYTNTGVVNESCFPYQGNSSIPCSDICDNPTERIKIGGRVDFPSTYYPRTEESLKKMIIRYGPISGGISSWGHAMTLSGYYNDTIDNSVVWIFKNSWGASWGDNGWGYIKVDMSDIGWTHALLPPVTSLNYTNADIVCEDRDGDGYYFWGIGPKPAHCPPCAPDEPDGDDSNPNLGPMDEYGYCEAITPLVENITTSQTWNTNRTVCRNLVVQSGTTLTITATVFMQAHKVTTQNGGKIILSGGTIDNGNIIAQSGSELTITNNGKILLGSYDNLDIQLGAIFNDIYGEILLK
ncbi:MAG: C1 family peptidase [Prevotella sp.]|jgi:C1A family cysteine protease|nr:C1 family peptidase [Prevotella sp.]